MTLEYTVVAPNRIRRVMASRMRSSAAQIPQVTLQSIADSTRLVEAALSSPPDSGARLTVTVHLLHLVAETLTRHPRINSWVVGGQTRLFRTVNVGVAIATEQGLVVPVVADAASLSLAEIAARLQDLRERAKSGTLAVSDMADATFTITNLGPYGVQHFNPLVNPPQVAVLGVGAATPRLKPVDGACTARDELPLSLTFDHAAVDGAEAASFLRDLTGSIEQYGGVAPGPVPRRETAWAGDGVQWC